MISNTCTADCGINGVIKILCTASIMVSPEPEILYQTQINFESSSEISFCRCAEKCNMNTRAHFHWRYSRMRYRSIWKCAVRIPVGQVFCFYCEGVG